MNYPRLAAILIPAFVVTTSGCSNKSEMDAMKAQLSEIQQVATDAKTMAASNSQAIQLATATANTAAAEAEAAKRSSEETNTKIDRLFKRSMHK